MDVEKVLKNILLNNIFKVYKGRTLVHSHNLTRNTYNNSNHTYILFIAFTYTVMPSISSL